MSESTSTDSARGDAYGFRTALASEGGGGPVVPVACGSLMIHNS